MALRNRNPGEPRKSDSPTKRIASKFMGMITGEPDSKVSPNYATLIENMIDRGEYSTVRSGSKQYTTQLFGDTFTAILHTDPTYPDQIILGGVGTIFDRHTGDCVYFIGDDLPSPLLENTPYYWNDLMPTVHTTKESAYENGAGLVQILDVGSGDMYVFLGKINAKCDHVKAGFIILHCGKSVYVANKSFTFYGSTYATPYVFRPVLNLYHTELENEETTIIPFGDNAIFMSKTVGLFKIFLGSDFNYMTRINENPPNILITDIAKTVLKVYGYLFMQSLARITGSGNRDRTSSGAILDVETTTCYLPGTERDYGEVYYDSEIGVDVTVDHIICDNAVLATVGLGVYGDRARGMTHMPLYRTKDIGAGGSSSGLTGVGNRRDQPVWDADIPLCKALKVDSSSTPGSLVISGSSNKWVRGDIGSRCIVVSAAGSVGIGRITGFTSENAVTITAYATYTIPTSTECYACIGGYRVMKASSATYSGISYNWNMITPDATAKNGVFSYNDIGRIIYVSDGSIRHIKQIISVGGVLCAIVEEIGTMSELFGNIVSTLDFSNLCIAIQNDTNSASVLAYNRAWNDTIPDSPQADGRVSLQDRIDYGTDLYIPRRMFRPMPNGDTGIIDNGFLVVAERDKGEYNYCQTGDKPYCIGQYKYPEQRREVVGAISHITGYPFMALVTMYDKTGIITLSSSQNIGRTEIGENIFQLPELSVVDDKHGVIAWKTITYKNSNLIFALTSDSAFRYFSGTAWSKEDLAYVNGLDAVSKEYLRKIDHNNIKGAVYGMNGGIKIWFQMLVGGVLTDMCLRFSTETGEGYGWSLITGTDWVFPIDEQGVFSILDDNDIQRVLVIDKNDYQIYEIDTFDRSTVVKAPVLDKEDVEDTEITWKRRGVEHIASIGSEQKRLIHEMSYENIEPSDKANRGETGYTATGQRNAQELTLKTFFDGERTDESARAEDFPESGEIVFTGRKKEANKILMELSGTAGELNLTGMTDVFLIEERAPTRDRRVMTEHTIALALLAGKSVYICRSETLYNRVTATDLGGGTVTKLDGPDGKADSGFTFTEDVICDNAVLALYTIVLWSTDANLFTGLAGWTTYGAAVGTWQMYYLTGANLGAAVVMEAGSKFDIRIYSKVLTAAQLALLREDTVDFEGKMLLPGFIGN